MSTYSRFLAILIKESKINYRNFTNILSVFLFFLLGIIIFIFSIGFEKDIINQIGYGIIWTLIILSNTLSIRNFFQSDFDNNSLIIIHMSGFSYEIISLIKILIIWIIIQIPFFITIPIAIILLDIDIVNYNSLILSFLMGSVIITCITSMSASMNLLNNKNFSIGSLIIMILSLPVIIFGVGIMNAPADFIRPQINILLGVMLFFLAISPWICGLCIKLSFQNK